MVGGVTGVSVDRAEDGRIKAIVRVISPYQQLADLNRMAGIGDFEFFCSDEFVSTESAKPTIFQNVLDGRLDPGAQFSLIPGTPQTTIPIGFHFTVYTEATGYLFDDTFVGMLLFEYDYQIIRGRPSGNPRIDAMIAACPPTARIEGEGEFIIQLQPNRN
jgi:hypothetical protein